MESLNRIELRGTVGAVRVFNVGDRELARFSVATNYGYKDKDGTPVIETTWHNVVAWDVAGIQKGDRVEVIGRLRKQRYTDANGNDREVCEVIANKVRVI